MLYFLIPVVVPLFIYAFLPIVLEKITGKQATRNGLLLVACLVYCVSWFLPSPLIAGKDTSFTTHVIGGGVFSGLLWLYIKNYLDWRAGPLIEFASLYAFVCTLGVTNELFEWAIVQLHLITKLNGVDTWWDLVANTVGMLLFWLFYKFVRKEND
jgi:hypothetical protein